jgi:hypothetical protein
MALATMSPFVIFVDRPICISQGFQQAFVGFTLLQQHGLQNFNEF